MKFISVLLFVTLCLAAAPVINTALSQTVEWEHHHGDTTTSVTAFAILQTSDQGYMTAGNSIGDWQIGAGGEASGYIARFDRNGEFLWDRKIGDGSVLVSIIPWHHNGHVVVGAIADSVYTGAIDSAGNALWSRTRPHPGIRVTKAIPTRDGGFAVIGSVMPPGSHFSRGLAMCKYDSMATCVWSRTIDSTGLLSANTLVQTDDGGYAISGTGMFGNATHNDAYLLRLNEHGEALTIHSITTNGWTTAFGMLSTGNGSFVLGCGFADSTMHISILLVMVDSLGAEVWHCNFGDSTPNVATVFGGLAAMSDGGFVVTGSKGQQYPYLLRLDAAGRRLWDTTYRDSMPRDIHGIVRTNDGSLVITGGIDPESDLGNVLIMKIGLGISAVADTQTLPARLKLW